MAKFNSFVYCTDSHLANRPPAKRIDDYNKSILKKLQWAIDYAVKKKVDGFVFGGDLCHTYKTNDELIYKFVEMMGKSGLQFYYLYGNHDIQSGNVNFIQKTNMGLLSHYPWFHELDSEYLHEFEYCYLTGINYSHEKECAQSFNWWEGRYSEDHRAHLVDNRKQKILVTHAMITNGEIVIAGEVKSVDVNRVDTNADILLNGHYHDGHKNVVHSEALERTFKIVNPGSIARMNLKEAKDSHGPRLAYIKVYKGHNKIKLVKIPRKPINQIFDLQTIHTEKNTKDKREKFLETLTKMTHQKIMGDNFEDALKDVLSKPPKKLKKCINKRTRNILLERLEKFR